MVGGHGICGAVLLFAAFALLLIATISSPVFRQISFLNIYSGGQTATFGTFGYCVDTSCTPRQLGYDITALTGAITNNTYVNENIVRLTKAFILHPIAAGLSFISLFIALFSDHIGYLFASFICFLAFLVSLLAMAIDFAVFVIIRNQVNNNAPQGVSAMLGNAIWMVLAATVTLFFATFIVCFSCCTHRRESRGSYGGGYNSRWNNRY